MQADLKRRMARLREEQEHGRHGLADALRGFYRVPREGAGQVVLVGAAEHGEVLASGRR